MNLAMHFGGLLSPVFIFFAAQSLASAAAIEARARNLPIEPTHWRTIYDGYGKIEVDPVMGLLLEPKAPTKPEETSAALVLSSRTERNPVKDFEFTVEFTVESQLRKEAPREWETLWLFFNYTVDPAQGKKRTNYFILKPRSGIELGTAFDESGQRFLYTAPQPSLGVGARTRLSLRKKGRQVDVSVNGVRALSYPDPSSAIFDVPGAIGFYSEDARVRIHAVSFRPLDG